MTGKMDTRLSDLWAFTIDGMVVDLRNHEHAAVYDPNDSSAAQKLGAAIRANGDATVVYRSVRRTGGECVGVFRPTSVATMHRLDDWRLIWNGTDISETLRVA